MEIAHTASQGNGCLRDKGYSRNRCHLQLYKSSDVYPLEFGNILRENSGDGRISVVLYWVGYMVGLSKWAKCAKM